MSLLSQIEYFIYILDSLKAGYLLLFVLGIVWVRFLISVADGALAPRDPGSKREEANSIANQTKELSCNIPASGESS